METKVKEIRVKLDGITQLINQFRDIDNLENHHINDYTFINHTIQSLQLSKMWLGKVLKELGIANPYPESKNPANEKIEPTADTGTISFPNYIYTKHSDGKIRYSSDKHIEYFIEEKRIEDIAEPLTYIQKVKWLRAEVEKIEDTLKDLDKDLILNGSYGNSWLEQHIISSINNCIEAGMWLGMELGRINNQK